MNILLCYLFFTWTRWLYVWIKLLVLPVHQLAYKMPPFVYLYNYIYIFALVWYRNLKFSVGLYFIFILFIWVPRFVEKNIFCLLWNVKVFSWYTPSNVEVSKKLLIYSNHFQWFNSTLIHFMYGSNFHSIKEGRKHWYCPWAKYSFV